MNQKSVIKMGIDIAMSVVLFVTMSYQFIGKQNHEIAGTVMLVLFVLHHVMNYGWYKTLGKGRYLPQRILQIIIDLLLLIDIIGLGGKWNWDVTRCVSIP